MALLCYDIYSIIFDFIFENDHHKHNADFANKFLLAFGETNPEATKCCIHVLKRKMCNLFGYDRYNECDNNLTIEILAKIMNKKSVLNYPFVKNFDNSLMHINFDNIKKPSHRKLLYYLYLLNGYAYTTEISGWEHKFYPRKYKSRKAFFGEFYCDCFYKSKLVDGVVTYTHDCKNKLYGFNCDKSRTLKYLMRRKIWHPEIYDKVMYGSEERYILNKEKADNIGVNTCMGTIIEFEKSVFFVKICDV
jgi:hypothetical protein